MDLSDLTPTYTSKSMKVHYLEKKNFHPTDLGANLEFDIFPSFLSSGNVVRVTLWACSVA